MRVEKSPGSYARCNNCGESDYLELQIPQVVTEEQLDGWAWVCPHCKTRIHQVVTCPDPFTVATEVVPSRLRRSRL